MRWRLILASTLVHILSLTLTHTMRQVREHELDEEKAEADANNSNALSGELAERKRALEQWSVAAYGEVL